MKYAKILFLLGCFLTKISMAQEAVPTDVAPVNGVPLAQLGYYIVVAILALSGFILSLYNFFHTNNREKKNQIRTVTLGLYHKWCTTEMMSHRTSFANILIGLENSDSKLKWSELSELKKHSGAHESYSQLSHFFIELVQLDKMGLIERKLVQQVMGTQIKYFRERIEKQIDYDGESRKFYETNIEPLTVFYPDD